MVLWSEAVKFGMNCIVTGWNNYSQRYWLSFNPYKMQFRQITMVHNTLNPQWEKRTIDRALWTVKQGMCERARAVWEKANIFTQTFLGPHQKLDLDASGRRFNHLSWLSLQTVISPPWVILSLFTFLVFVSKLLYFLPCVSEISILSQLSITLLRVNVKKSFAQPNLEMQTFSKEKKKQI